MRFLQLFTKAYKYLLPSPFAIAILLTLVVFVIALFGTTPENTSLGSYSLKLLGFWENGLWKTGGGGLYFAFQMMLMLVLGHTLALSKPVAKLLDSLVGICKTTAISACLVTLVAILFSLFNWGLGLIVGAILARKIGEHFQKQNKVLNYGLIGAGAYSGLMVWHGGLSGSAPIKASEMGNLQSMVEPDMQVIVPNSISMGDTVFSTMNIVITMMLIIVVPLIMFFIGKKSKDESVPIISQKNSKEEKHEELKGIGKMDTSKIFALMIGLVIIFYCIYKAFFLPEKLSLSFLNPNFINLMLLGLGISFHLNFRSFLGGANDAIKGSTGILIQFPLYFGIMGIMQNSGLLNDVANYFVSISNEKSFPILTFFSAGLVNVFVPSGGGQWAVQGPVIIKSALELGVSLPKSIMALAYGDQLTNMLQPFWALPLLGITGLKAKDILPYTLILFLVGGLIFGIGLLVF